MDPALLTAVLSGALVALLLTLFGGGGSVLATPLLLYVVGVRDPHVAIGTSAAAVAVNAAVGLAAQAKAGRVKWPCALTFGAPGLVGSLVGAHLAKAVNGQHLLGLVRPGHGGGGVVDVPRAQPRPVIPTSRSTRPRPRGWSRSGRRRAWPPASSASAAGF